MRMVRRQNTARPIHETKNMDNQIVLDGSSSQTKDSSIYMPSSKESIGNAEHGGKSEYLYTACSFGCIGLVCIGLCIWLVRL